MRRRSDRDIFWPSYEEMMQPLNEMEQKVHELNNIIRKLGNDKKLEEPEGGGPGIKHTAETKIYKEYLKISDESQLDNEEMMESIKYELMEALVSWMLEENMARFRIRSSKENGLTYATVSAEITVVPWYELAQRREDNEREDPEDAG